jgi:hypothetical protein
MFANENLFFDNKAAKKTIEKWGQRQDRLTNYSEKNRYPVSVGQKSLSYLGSRLARLLGKILDCFFALSMVTIVLSPWAIYFAIPKACNEPLKSSSPVFWFAGAFAVSAPFAAGGVAYFFSKYKNLSGQRLPQVMKIAKVCLWGGIFLPFFLERLKCGH